MIDALGTIIGILGMLGITFVIEKTPIKISPLTLLKKFFVNEIKTEINEIKTGLNEFKEETKESLNTCKKNIEINEIDRIKQEILTFRLLIKTPNVNIKCLDFDHIFQLYDKYKKMGGNSMVDIAIEEIKIIYKEMFK